MNDTATPTATHGPGRWWVYQRERFPVFAHGPLIAAFSFSAVAYSAMLRGPSATPSVRSAVVAFATSFLVFLQLRIADEFKDNEEDTRYRPYRPVPRGLVTLRELGWVFALAAGVQLGLAVWLEPRLAVLLLGVWAYLGLMSVEFFAREWLKARPFTYMWTHMAIMPLVDLYATACDWLVAGESWRPPRGLLWFLLVSLFNGFVIEIGRKIRAPGDEEEGVDTYSRVWGRGKAVAAWLVAMTAVAAFAVAAARRIDFLMPVMVVLGVCLLTAAAVALNFLRAPATQRAKLVEAASGVWTLAVYLSLGGAPLIARHLA
jgi:4-hydroxybenzoate polyprenyltransferase